MKGIYRIKNKLTGNIYIGNTNSYEELKILKAGLHDNEKLQSDFNSFKENAFIVESIIEDIPEHEDIKKIIEEVILHENPYYNKFSIKEKQIVEAPKTILEYPIPEGLFSTYNKKSNFAPEVIIQLKEIMKQSGVRQSKVKGVPAAKMSKILNGMQCITLEDIEMIADSCNKKPKLIFE